MKQIKIDHKLINRVISSNVDDSFSFSGLGLTNSVNKDSLTFLDDSKYVKELLQNSNIKGVITTSKISTETSWPSHFKVIVNEDPRYAFYSLQNEVTNISFKESSFKSTIDSSARIHKTAYIADERVVIGRNVVIEPNVTILEDVEIGDDCVIRAGSVIGSEGFEHKKTSKGLLSVRHDGKVILGNRVEIGALNSISKGFAYRNTIVGDETRTDNLVHIAHGVQIGKRCLFPASCMIAGSCNIEDDVWIGPNASISSQVTIGKNAFVTIGSVVTKDVKEAEKVTGNFAIPHMLFLRDLKIKTST